MSANKNERIILNALGTKFEITLKKLEIFHQSSRLGKICQFRSLHIKELELVCDDYDLQKNEFFFNRDPVILKILLNYAITGEIHLNSNFCQVYVENEFKYWEFNWKRLKRCCKNGFVVNLDSKKKAIKVDAQILADLRLRQKIKNDTVSAFTKLSLIIENPGDSLAGLVYFIFKNFMLICWIVMFMYETLPGIREHMEKIDDLAENQKFIPENRSYTELSPYELITIFMRMDLIFNSYFLFDAFFRLAINPDKIQWLKKPINLIDLSATFLFFILFFISKTGNHGSLLVYVREVKESLRILLFYKITDLSWRLKTVSKSIKKSWRELLLACFFIALSVLISSTIMFYLELGVNSNFDSIPAVFWWSIITMTTVGYGDMHPSSPLGKFFAGLIATWGIIVITLPVAIIGSNFAIVYAEGENKSVITKEHQRDLDQENIENQQTEDAKLFI